MSGYVLVGVKGEARDQIEAFGRPSREHRETVLRFVAQAWSSTRFAPADQTAD